MFIDFVGYDYKFSHFTVLQFLVSLRFQKVEIAFKSPPKHIHFATYIIYIAR